MKILAFVFSSLACRDRTAVIETDSIVDRWLARSRQHTLQFEKELDRRRLPAEEDLLERARRADPNIEKCARLEAFMKNLEKDRTRDVNEGNFAHRAQMQSYWQDSNEGSQQLEAARHVDRSKGTNRNRRHSASE